MQFDTLAIAICSTALTQNAKVESRRKRWLDHNQNHCSTAKTAKGNLEISLKKPSFFRILIFSLKPQLSSVNLELFSMILKLYSANLKLYSLNLKPYKVNLELYSVNLMLI